MNSIVTTISDSFMTHVIVSYVTSTILLTFLLLAYVITNPSKLIKTLTHLIVGIVCAVIWFYLEKVSITDLILNFSLTYIVYGLVVKTICDKFGVNYNNGVGIIGTSDTSSNGNSRE